ncbi:hypothetical protein WMY93_011145 [Mugilogobius chulae]|uniref:Uncharacterized protein n=1 Tax=Mugilogobius chulae TaxID=88201 RepID=A0AAW0PAQ8_9GOBI
MSKKSGPRVVDMDLPVDASIIRIPPHHYIHVWTRTPTSPAWRPDPLTYIRQDNERVLFPPLRMLMVPPRHYCVILNPVARDDNDQVQFDQSGQAKLRHADQEIRLTQDPFPLYPGEEVQQDVTPLQIVFPDTALRLQALLEFTDSKGTRGRPETSGSSRDQRALHVRALRPFKDAGGRDRRTGEEWLVTMADREAHIPSVSEEVVGVVTVTTLSSRQYCVILDPVDQAGNPQLGKKRVVKGEMFRPSLCSSDVLVSSSGRDVSSSLCSSDVLVSSSGRDVWSSLCSSDVLVSSSGRDVSSSLCSSDVLVSSSGRDVSSSLCSSDVLVSSSGRDVSSSLAPLMFSSLLSGRDVSSLSLLP